MLLALDQGLDCTIQTLIRLAMLAQHIDIEVSKHVCAQLAKLANVLQPGCLHAYGAAVCCSEPCGTVA